MNFQKLQTVNIKVDISNEEKEKAKKLAKAMGYTFQGWLGQLIKRELKKEETND